MAYTQAEVVGPADNCQYTAYTLAGLDKWIAQLGKPDIIHWNIGLHDAGHNPKRSPAQIPIGIYRANLDLIFKRFRDITPHLIWATTTPVHPDRPFRDDQWSWRNEEIDRYNKIALELMEANNVAVNNLHALVRANAGKFLAQDQLHLSEDGQKACARAVAESISPFLRSHSKQR